MQQDKKKKKIQQDKNVMTIMLQNMKKKKWRLCKWYYRSYVRHTAKLMMYKWPKKEQNVETKKKVKNCENDAKVTTKII